MRVGKHFKGNLRAFCALVLMIIIGFRLSNNPSISQRNYLNVVTSSSCYSATELYIPHRASSSPATDYDLSCDMNSYTVPKKIPAKPRTRYPRQFDDIEEVGHGKNPYLRCPRFRMLRRNTAGYRSSPLLTASISPKIPYGNGGARWSRSDIEPGAAWGAGSLSGPAAVPAGLRTQRNCAQAYLQPL